MTNLFELIIALILIAMFVLFLREHMSSDTDSNDPTTPLLPRNHPMRINSRREFDALIARKQDTIIFVGAPWCGYCHNSIGPFMQAADGTRGKAFVLEVTGKELTKLVNDIGISAFPSILKAHSDGTRSKYDGERTEEAFRAFLSGDAPPEKKNTSETTTSQHEAPAHTVPPQATSEDQPAQDDPKPTVVEASHTNTTHKTPQQNNEKHTTETESVDGAQPSHTHTRIVDLMGGKESLTHITDHNATVLMFVFPPGNKT